MIKALQGVRAGLPSLALILALSGAAAATKPASSPPPGDSSPIQILPGTSSKEPVSVDADKLVYYDKERKAVYSGNVVVIQGDTKMTCSVMTVFLDRSPAPGPNAPANAPQAPSSGSGVKKLDAVGPVTVISKTQVATGDNASYDKDENKVRLIGHVTLSDGQNTTKGDKLTYDLKTGQAVIDTAAKNGRVHGQFLPNGGSPDQTKPK
jgi:lipopolysaccharide export system protein LptA